jgi:hypothetical protein
MFGKRAVPAAHPDDELPVVTPQRIDPRQPFRLFAEMRRYPAAYPKSPPGQEIYVFYDPRRGEVKVSLPANRNDPVVFTPDDLPEGQWVRLGDHAGRPLPLAVRLDPGGAQARWL